MKTYIVSSNNNFLIINTQHQIGGATQNYINYINTTAETNIKLYNLNILKINKQISKIYILKKFLGYYVSAKNEQAALYMTSTLNVSKKESSYKK